MKSIDPFLICPEHKVNLGNVTFPLELLFRGLLITGQPGAGKTRAILVPLIKSILRATGNQQDQKASMMVADPKGELLSIIEDVLTRIGRSEDLVVLSPGTGFFNPLSNRGLTPAEIPEKLVEWGNHTHRSNRYQSQGESEYWSGAQRALLTALVATTRAIHRTLTFGLLDEVFRRLQQFDSSRTAIPWLEQHNVPESAIRGVCDFLDLPSGTTRPCVANSVSNVLFFWGSEPLASLTTPDESIPEIDPIDIVHKGKILFVGCSTAAFGTSITPLLLSLKEAFFGALLARDQIEVLENDKWQIINQSRPVFVIADEAQAYMSNDPEVGELTALDRLRSHNAGMIFATQNISSMQSVLGDPVHADRLVSLLANHVYCTNICPATALWAEHVLGAKTKKEYQTDCSRELSPPLLFRETNPPGRRSRSNRVEITREVPRVNAGTLASMKTGEYWLRLADGGVHKVKTPFSSIITSTRHSSG